MFGTRSIKEEPFHALRLSDLDLEAAEIHRMALLFRGNIMATIKPWVFQHFLSKGAEMVLYIDSDFMIFETLSDLAGDGGDGVLLVRHVLVRQSRCDGMQPDETTLLGSGMFNAGMFGVGNQHGGFVEFLMERLRRECIFDPKQMRFNEQRWLDFVPAVFPHRVVKDPGVDVAYWNLHERPLEKRMIAGLLEECPCGLFTSRASSRMSKEWQVGTSWRHRTLVYAETPIRCSVSFAVSTDEC